MSMLPVVSSFLLALWPSNVAAALSDDSADRIETVAAPYMPIIAPPASTFPHIYRSQDEIATMLSERRAYGTATLGLKTLPNDVEQLKALLLELDREEKIVWEGADGNRAPIYALLQESIDEGQGDVHLLIGQEHSIEAQLQFTNELLYPGSDGLALSGIGYVADEMYGSDADEVVNVRRALRRWKNLGEEGRREMMLHSTQPYIDFYARTGKSVASDYLRDYVGQFSRDKSPALLSALYGLMEIATRQRMRFIASDLSYAEKQSLRNLNLADQYELAAREAFAVDNVQRHLDPERKDVVFYTWGRTHVEQEGLPKHIRFVDRASQEYSVILNGGYTSSCSSFDLALEQLSKDAPKWQDQMFAVQLTDYREGEIIIQLPSRDATQRNTCAADTPALMTLRSF